MNKKGCFEKPNTDNKGKLFVTLFAFYICTQDKFVMPVAPGFAHLFAI